MGNKHCEHLRVRVADRFCADCGVSVFVRLNPSGSYGPRDPEQYVSEPMRYLQHQLDELRGKVAALEQYVHDELNAAMLIRDMGQPFCAAVAFKGLVKYGRDLGLFPDPLTAVDPHRPTAEGGGFLDTSKPLFVPGVTVSTEAKKVQHFHDDPVFYANCPACVAGHAGVFNRKKGTDRKCEARFDGGRTRDCEVFPSQFKYPHCQVCGQHHEPPTCTGKRV